MCVLLLVGSPPKLPDDVPILALASQNILIRHESVEPNRSARMDPPSANPHLGTEPVAKAVREARAGVHEHARRVDAAHEGATGCGRLGHDAVGVVRAVRVDVRHGGCEGGYGKHGEREREVLGRVGFRCSWEYVGREEVGGGGGG